MEEITKKSASEIEDYIAKGIKEYKWSDEFLLKDLTRQGYNEEEARNLVFKVKNEKHINNKSIFEDEGDENKFSGTFELILTVIVIGGILSFVYPFFTREESSNFLQEWSDTIIGTFFCLFSIYAVIQAHRKKGDAIFLLKSYLVAVFFYNIIGIVLGATSMSSIYFNNPIRIVVMLAYCVGFYIYLCRSEQVKQFFPKEKRIVHIWDKLLASIFFFLPALLILLAIFSTKQPSDETKEKMRNYVERTQHGRDKASEISYNIETNTLSLVMLGFNEEDYFNDARYFQVAKELPKYLSDTSVIWLAVSEMYTNYDSLIYYFDAAKSNLDFKMVFHDRQVLLESRIDYEKAWEIINKQDPEKITLKLQSEMLEHSLLVAENFCPVEINEGLVVKSIHYNKEKQVVNYILQVDEAVWELSKETYLQLIHEYKNTIGFKDNFKSLNISMNIVLLGRDEHKLCEMTYSPEEI